MIESLHSPHVGRVKALIGSRGVKERSESGLFVAEGIQALREALTCQQGPAIETLYLSPSGAQRISDLDVTEVKIWIYAVENLNTPVTKDVDYVASLLTIDDSDNYINVGGVVINVSANTITVFNDERQIITLFSSLSSSLTNHKHIGGSVNPAPNKFAALIIMLIAVTNLFRTLIK